MKMQEYDESGNVKKGGGYYKKGGRLYKMTPEMMKMQTKAGMPQPNGDDEEAEKGSGSGMPEMSGADAMAVQMATGGQHENVSGMNAAHKDADMGMTHSERASVNKSALDETIDLLKGFAMANDPSSRKDFLLHKASVGELSKSETAELVQMVGGAPAAPQSRGEQMAKSFGGDAESFSQAFEVSDFLADLNHEIVKSLAFVGSELEKSQRGQNEFNVVLAKSIAQVAGMVKSLHETVEAFSAQPVSAPRSKGVRADQGAMAKSFAGAEPQGERLSKEAVLNTIDAMMVKSMDQGMEGRWASKFDLVHETAKVEQTGSVSPGFMEHVKAFRSSAH